MGKKGSSKKGPAATSGHQMSLTMREASTGKKQINVKSSLKLQHMKDLAVWASHDAAIPSLGAFFGHHFAASSEALGSPVDPSLYTCQRCESILHPGFNCTIRIEKNKPKSRHKGKKTTNHPRNNIVYTCNFCSHRNMKRGTPQITSQHKDKTHPKLTNNKSNNTLSSFKGRSADMNHIAASLGSRAENPGQVNMGILEACGTLKVKNDFVDTNTKAAPLRSKVDGTIGNFGIIEMSETLETKNDSVASGPNADDLEGGKMGILEISETLKVRDGSAHVNTITSPPGSTSDDPIGDIGNVEISETFGVINESTASAPNKDDPDRGKNDTLEISEAEDLRGNIEVVEISETLDVKSDNAASSPATPLTKPRLTLLDSKKKKRNRSAANKTPAPNSTSEAANANSSNRRRRKSWTSLKEIAMNNEKSRRLF